MSAFNDLCSPVIEVKYVVWHPWTTAHCHSADPFARLQRVLRSPSDDRPAHLGDGFAGFDRVLDAIRADSLVCLRE